MAKQKKPNAIMKRPNSSWFSNALKSVGAVSDDLIHDLLPYTHDTVGSVASVAKDIKTNIRKGMSSGKTVSGQIEKNSLIQMGKKALKNAAEDLKSGNLSNKDRAVDYGDGFNLNMDDNDFSFGDSDEDSDNGGDNTVINNVNKVDNGAILAVRESVNNQTNATIAGATATVNTMVAVSSNMMMINQKNMSEVLEKMNSIDSNIASMLTYMNENVTKYIDASIAHFEEVAPKKEGSYSSSSDEKASSETVFANGKFNAQEYIKYVKGNIKDSTVGSFVSIIKDMGPAFMGDAVANPVGTIIKAIGEKAISTQFKASLKTFDDTLQEFIPTMLERIADQEFSSGGGIAGTIGRSLAGFLGVRSTAKSQFARKKYEAGAAQFDNETKLAITEIIPSYLRDILSEISGNEKQVYDKEKMRFRNMNDVQNEIYGNVYSSVVGTFSRSAIGDKLNDRKSRLEGKDRDKFEDLVNRMYLGMSRDQREIDTNKLGTDESLAKYLAGGSMGDLKKMKQDYGKLIPYLIEALNNLTISEKSSINYTKIKARHNQASTIKSMEDAPDLYNLDVVNDGTSINQGVNEFHKRAYSQNAAVVAGELSASDRRDKRYHKKTLYDNIESIKYILLRGINVKTVDELGPIAKGTYTDDPTPEPPTDKKKQLKSDHKELYNEIEAGHIAPDIDQEKLQAAKAAGKGEYHKYLNSVVNSRYEKNAKTGASVRAARKSVKDDEQINAELANGIDPNDGHGGAKAVNKVSNLLQTMLVGGPGAASDMINQMLTEGFAKAEGWLNEKIFDPMKKTIFGDKENDPNKKGIFGGVKDSFTDFINGSIHALTGKGYTKLNPVNGEDAKVEDSENSVAHKAKKIFSDIKNGTAEYLFGKKNEETGKREGGFIGSLRDRLSERSESWCDSIFGKSKEGEEKSTDKMKKWVKDALPATIGGAGIGSIASTLMAEGLLGQLIAPGLGGLLGAGVGFISKSKRFQEFMFGKDNEDGTHIRGLISKKTQETLRDSKNMIIGGGAIGLIKGLIMPSSGILTGLVGGPMAGMLMGAGLGLMKKSQWFQELMYGKKTADGKHINGIKDKFKQMFSKTGGKDGGEGAGRVLGKSTLGGIGGALLGVLGGAGGGIFGSVALGILGGLAGSGASMMASSEKFKKMLFGEKDPDTGKRKGDGALGRLGMRIEVGVIKPLQLGAQIFATKMKYSALRLLTNLGSVFEPIKATAEHMVKSVQTKLSDWQLSIKSKFTELIISPIKHAAEAAMEPLKKAAGIAGKMTMGLIKAPLDFVSFGLKSLSNGLWNSLTKAFSKEGMKNARKAIFDSIKHAPITFAKFLWNSGPGKVIRGAIVNAAKSIGGFAKMVGQTIWNSAPVKAIRGWAVTAAKKIAESKPVQFIKGKINSFFKIGKGFLKKMFKNIFDILNPFKLAGKLIALPFKALGKITNIATTGLGTLFNAHKRNGDGTMEEKGMRDKFKETLKNKRDAYEARTGKKMGFIRTAFNAVNLLDPGAENVERARMSGELNDKAHVNNSEEDIKNMSWRDRLKRIGRGIMGNDPDEERKSDLIEKRNNNLRDREALEVEDLKKQFDLEGMTKRAKKAGFDPKDKAQILGKAQIDLSTETNALIERSNLNSVKEFEDFKNWRTSMTETLKQLSANFDRYSEALMGTSDIAPAEAGASSSVGGNTSAAPETATPPVIAALAESDDEPEDEESESESDDDESSTTTTTGKKNRGRRGKKKRDRERRAANREKRKHPRNSEDVPEIVVEDEHSDDNADALDTIAETAEKGQKEGSIYVNDIHSVGLLKSIYQLLVKKFTGEDVSDGDLDKLANPHLNAGIGAKVDKAVSSAIEDAGAKLGGAPSGQSPDNAILANGDVDVAESMASGADAVLAMKNDEAKDKDAEEDKERNEKLKAKSSAAYEKAKGYAKGELEKAKAEESDKKESEKTHGESKKQTGFLRKMLNSTVEHTKSFIDAFDIRKGAIAVGLIALAPTIFSVVKSLANGSFLSDIVGGIGQMVNNVFSNWSANRGLQGAAENVADLGDRTGEFLSGDANWMRNSNGDVDSLGSSAGRYLAKSGFKVADTIITDGKKIVELGGKVADTKFGKFVGGVATKAGGKVAEVASAVGGKIAGSKLGQTVAGAASKIGGVASKAGGKIAETATKVGEKVVNSKAGQAVAKAAGGVTKKIGELIKTFTEWLSKKFGQAGGKAAAKIGQEVTEEVIEKAAKKGGAKIVAAGVAKTAAAACSLGASELVWAALGAVDGMIKAAQLFEVRQEDLDGSMIAISTAFYALLGTTVGTVIDIAASIIEIFIGTNFIRQAAQLVWSIGKSEEDKQFYQNKKEAFKDDWRMEAYNKYLEVTKGDGTEQMSQEDFLKQDDATIANSSNLSLNDYNTSTNKDIFGHIGSFFGGIGDWFGKTFGGNKDESAQAIDTKWAGGVVTGNKPRLTMLSPGEIVYNPAGPAERAVQRSREEAARDKIYSKIALNANADDLGTVSNLTKSDSSPEFRLLNKIATVLTGIYGRLFGVNAYSYKSETDFKSDINSSGGILKNLGDVLPDWITKAIVKSTESAVKKIKVKNPDGNGYIYVDESEASKYDAYSEVSGGAGRGKSESDGSETKQVGNAKLYQQEDPTWNTGKLRNLDIYDAGCGPTAASIAASVYGSNMNPASAASIINSAGYRDSDGGTLPRGISEAGKRYGVDMQEGPVSSSNITKNLSQGKPVILMGEDGDSGSGDTSTFGNGMHYVVGTGIDPRTGEVQILDPLKKQPEKRKLSKFIGNTKSAIYTGSGNRYGKSNTRAGGGGTTVYANENELIKSMSNEERRRYQAQKEAAEAERKKRYSWMTPEEQISMAVGYQHANYSNEFPKDSTGDGNTIYQGLSYAQLLSHKSDPGYAWVGKLDEYWRSIYSEDTYNKLPNLITKMYSAEPSWISKEDLNEYYGIKGNRWKKYYKCMSNWFLETYGYVAWDDHGNLTITDEGKTFKENEETDASYNEYAVQIQEINDIIKQMGISPSKTIPTFKEVETIIYSSRMQAFVDVEFGELASLFRQKCFDNDLNTYVVPMNNYCMRNDDKVMQLINIGNSKLDELIRNKMSDIYHIAHEYGASGAIMYTEDRRLSLFNAIFPDEYTAAHYMAKHYKFLMNNKTFSNFVQRLLARATWIEKSVDIKDITYLEGRKLIIRGNVPQIDVIAKSIINMKKFKYSTERPTDLASGYGDSAGAVSYIYSLIKGNLKIPSIGAQMWASGKAITICDSTSIQTMSDLEIQDLLYAGDVLLYRNKLDPLESSIRHVELYAGVSDDCGWMIGHSGGSTGSTMGMHASKFSKSVGDLRLSKIIRFIKMEDTEVFVNVTMDVDGQKITWDDGEQTSMESSLFDKILGFLPEVMGRVWDGLFTGNWDSDYSEYWGTDNKIPDYTAYYANNEPDLNTATTYSSTSANVLSPFFAPDAKKAESALSSLKGHDNDAYSNSSVSAYTQHRLDFLKSSTDDKDTDEDNVTLTKNHRSYGVGKGRKKGRFGRGNSYTNSGETTVLPKGLGWYAANENWNAITAPSPQLDLKNKAKNSQQSLYDSDGYGRYGDRYVVATTETFGKAGDYIDIEQNDGNTIPAVIGDIKAWGVDTLEGRHVNKWGHNDGDVVLEVMDDASHKFNPTDSSNPLYGLLGGKTISSITNRGNVFTDGSPVNASGTLSKMSYSVSGHNPPRSDCANTLSPLAEGYQEWRAANGIQDGATCRNGESVYQGITDDVSSIYSAAPRPDGTSKYNGAAVSTGNSSSDTSSSSKSNKPSGTLNILKNAMSQIGSKLTGWMFGQNDLTALTEDEILNGSSVSSGSSDGYTLSAENDNGALPDSLTGANDQVGAQIAEKNKQATASNRSALYDPNTYMSPDRADGWFLNSMGQYAYKSSSFGEDSIWQSGEYKGQHIWDPCHKGIDIAAGTGTEILSPIDGTIASVVSGTNGFGKYITIIDSKKKYHHIFAHQNAFADGISVGKSVRRGDLIGYVGKTGYASGPHLHYQVDASSNGSSYINPNDFPYSVYSNDEGTMSDTIVENDTEDNGEAKGGVSAVIGKRRVSSGDQLDRLATELHNSTAEKVRSRHESEKMNKLSNRDSLAKGGDNAGGVSTTRLEKLTETMIDILNTISDNTLSTSQQLDKIKSSASNLKTKTNNTPKSTSTTPASSSNGSDPMTTTEQFARRIARGF